MPFTKDPLPGIGSSYSSFCPLLRMASTCDHPPWLLINPPLVSDYPLDTSNLNYHINAYMQLYATIDIKRLFISVARITNREQGDAMGTFIDMNSSNEYSGT